MVHAATTTAEIPSADNPSAADELGTLLLGIVVVDVRGPLKHGESGFTKQAKGLRKAIVNKLLAGDKLIGSTPERVRVTL